MNDVNPQMIKDTLSSLRNVKSSLFLTKKTSPNLKKIVEVCRFIDVLMLPLFYIWEYCCQKSILELGVEKHLMKPYERFLHNPLTYTWKFYLFLKLGIPSQMSTKTREQVLSVYETIILENNIKKRFKKA